MFDSKISAKDLILSLKDEVDIAIPIPNERYVLWLNALEQLLYTEYIQQQGEIIVDNYTGGKIDVESLAHDGQNTIRFEDIYAIYADDTQLIKSTLTSGVIFPESFYKSQNNIGLNLSFAPKAIKIIYFVKPALKTVDSNDDIGEGNVMLPLEFVDLMCAKLRGEAYKVANEDAIAAKWINDYNVLLENFKAWISGKRAEFGL